ncbi:MAG: DUF4258 domain-containing protein, partial [Chlamydiales bacterium]|nr:DUF4258 domain-containing protein [Chlamydiales bacterium]
GFGDGPNLYAYVKNSPLRYADQYGLEAEDISDTDSAEGDRSSSDDKSGFWSSVKDGASYVFDKVSGGVISFFEAGIEHNTVTLGKAYDNAPELAKDLVWGFTDVIKELEEGTFSDKSLGEQAKSIGLGVLDRVALFGGASLLGRTTKSIISNLNIWRTIEVRSQIVHNRGSNGFSGHKGYQLRNAKQQPTRNNNTLINNRLFSRHAIDQMQNRGIPPSAVKDTLCNGVREIGKERGTTFNYSSRNNISVITNSENGQVITVTYGKVQ